jgi:NADH:ubiquinone oxidoreductase subunit D
MLRPEDAVFWRGLIRVAGRRCLDRVLILINEMSESAGMVRHSLANVPPANVSVDYAHEMGISKPAGETKTETIVVQAEI